MTTFTEEIVDGKLHFLCSSSYFVETKHKVDYSFEVRLFCHIYLNRKLLFCNRKYVEGTLPRVWEVFSNVCYHEIGMRPP